MNFGSYTTTGLTLGKGAFGVVECVRSEDYPDKLFAMKCISKQNIIRENMGLQVSKEVSILKKLKHPNVVNIQEILMSESYLYIVMEYITGGELYEKIAKSIFLPEEVCIRYTTQICKALEFCHGMNVCHRDIKPQNILLDKYDNIKLVDFGFASIMEVEIEADNVHVPNNHLHNNGIETVTLKDIDTSRLSMEAPSQVMKNMHTMCGTTQYMAPEILTRNTYSGDKVDIWAFGTVVYLMSVGQMPFDVDDKFRESYNKPSNIGKTALDFISHTLDVDPDKRWSAGKLLTHKWLSSYREDDSNGGTSEEEEDFRVERQNSANDDDGSNELEIVCDMDEITLVNTLLSILSSANYNARLTPDSSIKAVHGSDMLEIVVHTQEEYNYIVTINDGHPKRKASEEGKLATKKLLRKKLESMDIL